MRKKALFTSCEDGRVRMWAVEPDPGIGEVQPRWTTKWAREFGGSSYGVVRSLLATDVPGEWAYLPSLFTGCGDNHIRLYYLKGGACVRLFQG